MIPHLPPPPKFTFCILEVYSCVAKMLNECAPVPDYGYGSDCVVLQAWCSMVEQI